MPEIKGGCLCGQVRYSANAEPLFTGICHCKNCQKQAGTAFSIVVAVPQAAMAVTGTTKTFNDKGDSGQPLQRIFCPNCGSPILTEAAAMPGVSIVKAGTLDDTSWLKPAMEIYCDSKQPWVELGGSMQRFPKMPPGPPR
jgi:hypothetical protein